MSAEPKVKIESLTEAQIAKIPEYREHWIKVGLSTEPADKPKAEEGIRLMYRSVNLTEPKAIYWFSSPMAMLICVSMLDKLEEQSDDFIHASLADARIQTDPPVLQHQIAADVAVVVSEIALKRIGLNPESYTTEQRRWLYIQMRETLAEGLEEAIRAKHGKCGDGQHDASWVGFYQFFRKECGLVEETEPLEGIRMVTESACWYYPTEEYCFISDRAKELHRDEEFRLHNPDGAAMLFRDGWGVYSIHGILVPDDIIEEPEKITWQRVVAESNAEVRRLMMDKMGKERLLRESEAKEVDRDRFGTLYRIEVKDDEPIQLLHVLNSTPNPDGSQKPYVLRVSPDVKTAHEAAASTFRLKAIEYWPGMES
jgi:hypothetical protein